LTIAHLPVAPVAQVTASFGTTMIQSGDSLESVLQRADFALYRAKEQGGNRVVSASAGEATPGDHSGMDPATDTAALARVPLDPA
jgi:predicted signal transduction protein with EAL and GGDEF domain